MICNNSEKQFLFQLDLVMVVLTMILGIPQYIRIMYELRQYVNHRLTMELGIVLRLVCQTQPGRNSHHSLWTRYECHFASEMDKRPRLIVSLRVFSHCRISSSRFPYLSTSRIWSTSRTRGHYLYRLPSCRRPYSTLILSLFTQRGLSWI